MFEHNKFVLIATELASYCVVMYIYVLHVNVHISVLTLYYSKSAKLIQNDKLQIVTKVCS